MKALIFSAILMTVVGAKANFPDLQQDCINELKKFPGAWDDKLLHQACAKVQIDTQCVSAEGRPIYHYEKISSTPGAKRFWCSV
ncbi:hypothetical protein [Bdellovibrio bacteriovorus]|uniref:hypothetical protein n=1 Tax=Bdellovibrio bacteriovorus TaxID=959 RepID=UPI0035A65ABF